MSNGKATLEWQVSDDESVWHTRQQLTPDQTVQTNSWLSMRWRYALLAALILSLATGAWLWYTSQVGIHQIEAEIDSTVQAQLWAIAQGESNPDVDLTMDRIDLRWRIYFDRASRDFALTFADGETPDEVAGASAKVEMIDLQDSIAAVQVVTTSAPGKRAYRQTQFYQQTANGWLRTAPVESLWGSPHHFETDHFILHYRQRDAHVVAAVAEQLDALYLALLEDMGLPVPVRRDKLTVEISVSQLPGRFSPGARMQDALRIASPALYLAPVEMTDAELLSQAVALVLLEEALAHAIQHHRIPTQWQPLLSGLRLWELWKMELPLSIWHDDVITWLYKSGPAATDRKVSVLPEHYEELCVMHRQWMLAPSHLQIPLRCNDLDQREWLPVWSYVTEPPLQLTELTTPWRQSLRRGTFRVRHPGAAVAQATLIDYGTSAYGREFVPLLLAELAQYDDWETLLPAHFGVSAAQFEDGWHEYLADKYQLQLP